MMKANLYIKRPLEFQNAFCWDFDKHTPSIYDIPSIKEVLEKNSVYLFSCPSDCHEEYLIDNLAKYLNLKTPFISSENKKHHNKAFKGNVNYIGYPEYESKHIVFDKTTGKGFTLMEHLKE